MYIVIVFFYIYILKATVTDLICPSDGVHERKPRCEFFENLLFLPNFVQFIKTDWLEWSSDFTNLQYSKVPSNPVLLTEHVAWCL